MFKLLQVNLFNKILTGIVFTSVFFSLFLEVVFNIIPCKLCLYQRYMWIFLLIACFLNAVKKTRNKYSEMIIILTLCGVSGLSFYHSGIELGIFNNIISCISEDNGTANSIEELDSLIRNKKNMDCAFPKFKIFNLSLSNLGFFLGTSLLLLCLKKYNRNIFK